MMSLETIRALTREVAREAAEEHRTPLVPYGDVEETIRGIPNLGAYRPKGWRLVKRLFVDKSGLGSESEPAMTFRAFCAWVTDHLDKEYGYGLIEEGQFQAYVGVFRRTEPKLRAVK